MRLRQQLCVILILLLVMISMTGACTKAEQGQESELENSIWVLEQYGRKGSLRDVLPETRITATFDSAESQVEGTAGCNHYFGLYEINGNTLSIPGSIAATEMYCMEPEGVMDQEKEYLTLLSMVDSFEVHGDELTINCGDQVLLFSAD